jgi:exodeoxyribonuclease V alpha subunit
MEQQLPLNGTGAPPEQADIEPIVTLEGTVERIVFESPASGYLVARLRQSGVDELRTIVGRGLAVSPGETVRLRGRWVDDKKWGLQLRVESYETLQPTTLEGIEKYLASGLIEGIGPTYARRIVETFGPDTLRVIADEPDRLKAVPGLGGKRIEQIRAAWSRQKSIQSLMIFLQGHGVTPAQAVRIYQAYGEKAAAIVRQNPYQLARDIPGIAFATADTLAGRLGVDKEAPQRLEAGIEFTLWRAMNEGHCYLPDPELRQDAARMLGVAPHALDAALIKLVTEGQLVREGGAIYLPLMHAAERGCAEKLKRLMATPHQPPPVHLENALKWVEKTGKIYLSPEQREAIARGVQEKVLIITGGPGTGKTTVINSLLAILEKKGLSFLLAAPTGRAAKRMEQATGRPAGTLHRLLEFQPQTGGFSRNGSNPLHADLIVVDEASMMDLPLMHALLAALPPFARLLLVGDADQLPAVGPGNVLMDLIASNVVPAVTLKTVFRQAAESGIIDNAHRVNRGDYPKFNTRDFFLIERHTGVEARDTLLEVVTERMPRRFGLDPRRDIQVLSPLRRGDAGVNALNTALQDALNPEGTPIPRRQLRVGDKVMQLRNNYDLEIFNGDIGFITAAIGDTGALEVTFEGGRTVEYPPEIQDDLTLAYAATVHKAQGAEYPAIVLLFLPQHYLMLHRNVLYTAITRAKRTAIIIGDPKAIRTALHNTAPTRRHTRLCDRLRNKI